MDSQQPEETSRGSYLSLMMTAFFGGGFLLFLVLVSGGFFLYVSLAVLVMGMVGLLHWVLWGQALTDEVAAEREAMEERDRREAELHLQQFDRHRIRKM